MDTALCREVGTTHTYKVAYVTCHMAVGVGGITSNFHRVFNSEKSTGLFLHCVRDSARCCRLVALKPSTYIYEVFAQLGCGTTSLDAWCSRFQDSVAVWSSRVQCHELSLAFFANKFGSTKLAKLKSRKNVGVRYVLSPVCSTIYEQCPTTQDPSLWQFYFLRYIPHTRQLHPVITVLIELVPYLIHLSANFTIFWTTQMSIFIQNKRQSLFFRQ